MGKKLDLTGQRFGKLVALSECETRLCTHVVWKCQCDCGKIAYVTANTLRNGRQISCGCNRLEKSVLNLSGNPADKLGQIEGTNVSEIRSNKPQINNKSGFRGVSWQKNGHGNKGHYVAVIYFKGKQYFLGCFKTPEEAHHAYMEAKDKTHGDFVRWYDETIKKSKTNKSQNL